jgi:hypothetical protein
MADDAGFLRILEIDARRAREHRDAFARMRGGDLDGVLVRDVYPPDVLSRVVERLERHDPPFLKTSFPAPFKSEFYGRNLNLTHPDLRGRGYFAEAARFHDDLAALFRPSPEPVAHVGDILAALDAGRPFRAPPGPAPGECYMFTTLRVHHEGGFIPPHCDNEHALRPAYAHLLTLIEPHLMSFVLALTQADGGGALEVFDLRFDTTARSLMNDDRARPIDTTGVASVTFRLSAGAMIVLDSGRYLHRVTPVIGPRKRWTACSFMARSRAGDATYCWG